jgi:hypothetical protein
MQSQTQSSVIIGKFQFILDQLKISNDHWISSSSSMTYIRANTMYNTILGLKTSFIKNPSQVRKLYLKVSEDHLRICFHRLTHSNEQVAEIIQAFKDIGILIITDPNCAT